jgi:16S rRNA (cytosine1407-C5)-methyltransferase
MRSFFSSKNRGNNRMPENALTPLDDSLRRFSKVLTKGEIEKILKLQQEPISMGIRINPLKAEPYRAMGTLSSRYGWHVAPLSFCDNGWIILASKFPPGLTIEHRLGQYYLQDPSSMIPVSLFNIDQSQPLILDMAASPGGKTTHLVDRTLDRGFILANDASKTRINALRAVLSSWGAINLAVTNFPGEAFGSWYPETFDLVLLDAPCSMENLRPSPSHPQRETTQDERLRLGARQIQLLTSGLQALKVGGQLVYATCSLAPEEDELVIDAVLKNYPDTFSIEDVSNKFTFEAPGLTQFEDSQFSPSLAKTLRLWPHITGMSGFFCALLTKNRPLPVKSLSPPSRDFAHTNLVVANQDSKQKVFQQLFEDFDLDLRSVVDVGNLCLYQRFEQYFLIPNLYLKYFINLPYDYIGMPLGRWVNDLFEPSLAFISRFGHQFMRGKIPLTDEDIEFWTQGRDIRQPETNLTPKGQYLMVTDGEGRNLGLGKLLPKRLRNLLPRQLF